MFVSLYIIPLSLFLAVYYFRIMKRKGANSDTNLSQFYENFVEQVQRDNSVDACFGNDPNEDDHLVMILRTIISRLLMYPITSQGPIWKKKVVSLERISSCHLVRA